MQFFFICSKYLEKYHKNKCHKNNSVSLINLSHFWLTVLQLGSCIR